MKEKKPKTQSQKIRSLLYLLWQKDNDDMTQEEYYKAKTDKYISFLIKKLEEDVPLPDDP